MMHKFLALTAIEMLIAMVVMGILITIVYPCYKSYILKCHRIDAISSLLSLQFAEEKYRYTHIQYGTLRQIWNDETVTPSGYYDLSIPASTLSATDYTIIATARNNQTEDIQNGILCNTLTLRYNNGNLIKIPSACWH